MIPRPSTAALARSWSVAAQCASLTVQRAARKDKIDGDDVPDQDGTEECTCPRASTQADASAPAKPTRKRQASGQSHDKRKTKQTKCVGRRHSG